MATPEMVSLKSRVSISACSYEKTGMYPNRQEESICLKQMAR